MAVAAGIGLCSAGLVASPSQSQPSQPPPGGLDRFIHPLVLAPAVDLELRTESLDASASQTESSSQLQVVLAADVLFAFNRADLSPAAEATLSDVAQTVRTKARGQVKVDGYTDAVGDDAYNLDLSNKRAEAVASRLEQLSGEPSSRFVVSGHGKADPVAPNTNADGSDNSAGRAKNRRVTVTFPV